MAMFLCKDSSRLLTHKDYYEIYVIQNNAIFSWIDVKTSNAFKEYEKDRRDYSHKYNKTEKIQERGVQVAKDRIDNVAIMEVTEVTESSC